MCFDSITSLITHKRHYCKLRFTCKCESDTERLDNCGVPAVVTCSTCGQDFDDPWDLMEHVQVGNSDKIQFLKTGFTVQDVHTLNIYQLCDDNQNVPVQ